MKTRKYIEEGKSIYANGFRLWLTRLLIAASMGMAASLPTLGKSLVDANTDFALDLYQQLDKNQGNIFFSPYSISTALAMTYAGARGQTEEQMAAVLHFNFKSAPTAIGLQSAPKSPEGRRPEWNPTQHR
jgi:hypothetical protein